VAHRGTELFWFDRALLLADCELHFRYLVLLLCDDVLSESPKLLVVTILEFCPRHIDRVLMMRDHHGDEVAIYVARRLDEHARARPAHGQIIVEQELLLVGIRDCSWRRCGFVGSSGKAKEVAVTDRVVASEMTRLRTKACDNRAISDNPRPTPAKSRSNRSSLRL
jgi:hypothetical protein